MDAGKRVHHQYAQFAYQFTNGDFNYWDGYYDNLQDYQFVVNNADANGQKFLKGPAKVMKAMLFQQLVDMYGNIPYTDALKGAAVLAPKFDDQKAMYESLITPLDEAIVDLKANPFTGSFGTSDIVFGGNVTKWAQFANSLKMRILIRQSKVSGRDTYIKTEINKIVTAGVRLHHGRRSGYWWCIFLPACSRSAESHLRPVGL